MDKILITGHKGFIAKYVIAQLKDQYELVFPEDNLFEMDMQAYMKDVRPQYLIHLAWVTGVGYLDSVDNLRMVAKSIEMYEAFFNNGGKRCVYVGTEQEYKRQDVPLSETDELAPASLYAQCKCNLGEMLVKYSRLKNYGFVWNRLFFIYGIGEKPKRLMPAMIKSMVKGDEVSCSCRDYVRDYIHVHDVASGIITSLFSDYIGAVNICGGNHTTIGEIGDLIASFEGAKGSIQHKTHEMCGQDYVIQGDNSLLRSLGWTPRYTLEEGVREEYTYYQRMYENEQKFLDE